MKALPRYAVIGNPVAHSLSPEIHQDFARQAGRHFVYEKIQVASDQFEEAVRTFFQSGGCGLNVTQPYKQRAYALSEAASFRCQEAEAANTLWMQEGVLHADNTDGVGLVRDILCYQPVAGQSIVLVGAGGAARGVLPALLSLHPARLCLVNRTQAKADDLEKKYPSVSSLPLSTLACQKPFEIIINATPAGQSPVLPPSMMTPHPFCYDLAYQQGAPTPFVAWARQQGCVAVDGIGMLLEQAAESFRLWHGVAVKPNHSHWENSI